MTRFTASLAVFVACTTLQAQEFTPELVRVDDAAAGITLDGFINEGVWRDLPVIDGMKVINPDTLDDPSYRTEIRFFYTERGIYIGAMNHQPADTLVARMTPRDTRLLDRDAFAVSIDPSGEGLYGYFVRINLGDSLADATILPERQFNIQWNGSWNGRTQALENGWSAEIFIPWAMMALPASGTNREIGFYFERQVGHLGGENLVEPRPYLVL